MKNEALLVTSQEKLNTLIEKKLKPVGKLVCQKELENVHQIFTNTLKGLRLSDKKDSSFFSEEEIESQYLRPFIQRLTEVIKEINQEEAKLEHEMGPQKDFSFHPEGVYEFTYKVRLRNILSTVLADIYSKWPHLQ